MRSWYFELRKEAAGVPGWLALNAWRQVWRRRLSGRLIMGGALVALAGYGLIVFALTKGLLADFRGLGLDETGGIWFGLCVYGSVVPVVTAILALTFRPLFAEPSEVVAGVPISVKEWYGSQIGRYAVGTAVILGTTWTAVTLALVQILEMSWAAGLLLEVVMLAANFVAVGWLMIVVSKALIYPQTRAGRWLPIGLVVFMAAMAVYVRVQQETGLKSLAVQAAAHGLLFELVAVAVGLAAGVMAIVVVQRELARKAAEPLKLTAEARLSSWRQRGLRMPRTLVFQLMVMTLRGLVADRKNVGMLGSSLALFLGFGLVVRIMHSASLNSLILGATAVYLPLFLSLIMIFGRSTLGNTPQTIYTRPLSIWWVAAGQFMAATVASAVITAGFLALMLQVVGNRIDHGELAGLAVNAAISSAIAWLCGLVLRVTPRENVGILIGVAGVVAIQGSFYAVMSKFADRELLSAGFKLLLLLGLYGLAVAAEFGYSGKRWNHG